jgi:hypothetical protein
MGSGEAVARLIEGQPAAEISQHMGANLDTFAPKGRAMHSPLFARICRAIWNV